MSSKYDLSLAHLLSMTHTDFGENSSPTNAVFNLLLKYVEYKFFSHGADRFWLSLRFEINSKNKLSDHRIEYYCLHLW